MGDNFEKLRFVFENDALRLKMREHFVLRIIEGEYTYRCILAFPNIKVSLDSPLSLYDKTIRFSFPFLNKDRIQLKLNTVDFNSFPSS